MLSKLAKSLLLLLVLTSMSLSTAFARDIDDEIEAPRGGGSSGGSSHYSSGGGGSAPRSSSDHVRSTPSYTPRTERHEPSRREETRRAEPRREEPRREAPRREETRREAPKREETKREAPRERREQPTRQAEQPKHQGINAQTKIPSDAKVTNLGSGRQRHEYVNPQTGKKESVVTRGDGTISSRKVGNETRHYDPSGKVKGLERKDAQGNVKMKMSVSRKGEKTFSYRHDDGSQTVRKGNQVYHQRTLADRQGRKVVQRITVRNNVTYVTNYRTYNRGGYVYYGYTPYYYYSPVYYSYLYDPWLTPVAFGWGLYPSWSWRGYPLYAGYFDFYPVYYGPSWWLTDYLIADMLAVHYANEVAEAHADAAQARADAAEAQADAAQARADAAKIQVDEAKKAQLRKQVEAEVKAQQNKQSLSVADILASADASNHIFVVTDDLEVSKSGDQSDDNTCDLSTGDLIKLNSAVPADADKTAMMKVVAAKKGGCRAGTVVEVSLEDLQEMQNTFAQTIEKGEKEMHQRQGKNGIPAAPQAAQVAPEKLVDSDEAQARAALDQANTEASQAEQQAAEEASAAQREADIARAKADAARRAVEPRSSSW